MAGWCWSMWEHITIVENSEPAYLPSHLPSTHIASLRMLAVTEHWLRGPLTLFEHLSHPAPLHQNILTIMLIHLPFFFFFFDYCPGPLPLTSCPFSYILPPPPPFLLGMTQNPPIKMDTDQLQ